MDVDYNGIKIELKRRSMIFNGERIKLPKFARRKVPTIEIINDVIFVNGYKFDPDTRQFKEPLWFKALVKLKIITNG